MAQQAYDLSGEKDVISAIDARMSEVYSCLYNVDAQGIMQAACDESVLQPDLLAEHYKKFTEKAYAVGTGWDAYTEILGGLKTQNDSPEILFPHAEAMLKIGIEHFKQGKGVSAEHAQPVYVRDTVSWKKLPGK